MSTLYEDTPLHIDASTNIRLLEIIQADDETAPIACTLRVIALQESPKYTALSYVWGPPTPAKDIIVNGKPLTVRENLWNFLHQARKDRATCALWIDAICIDQDSNPERTHQVAMMGKIYSETELVLVWLGTATRYSAQWERAMKTIPIFHNDDDLLGNFKRNFKRWYKVYGPSVVELYKAPYWSRIWIIQEYSLAPRKILQCGSHKTTGEAVMVLWRMWINYLRLCHGIKKRPSLTNCSACMVVGQQIKLWADHSLEMLVILVGLGLPRECADRRDRVYSLLTLCGPLEHPIIPDYSKSLPDLYSELVHRAANNQRCEERLRPVIVLGLREALMLEETDLKHLSQETKVIIEDYKRNQGY